MMFRVHTHYNLRSSINGKVLFLMPNLNVSRVIEYPEINIIVSRYMIGNPAINKIYMIDTERTLTVDDVHSADKIYTVEYRSLDILCMHLLSAKELYDSTITPLPEAPGAPVPDRSRLPMTPPMWSLDANAEEYRTEPTVNRILFPNT